MQKAVVLRPFNGDGRTLHAGEVHNVEDWRNAPALERQRYIRTLSEYDPAPLSEIAAIVGTTARASTRKAQPHAQ